MTFFNWLKVLRVSKSSFRVKQRSEALFYMWGSKGVWIVIWGIKLINTLNTFKPIQDWKELATGLCVPFVDISLRASFYSASHSLTEIRAGEFAWPLKHHAVLYRLSEYSFCSPVTSPLTARQRVIKKLPLPSRTAKRVTKHATRR